VTDEEEEAERRARAPYFFLSYARTPAATDSGRFGGEADEVVIKFYEDLCTNIHNLAAIRPGASAGYLDRAMGTATDWESAVMTALGTCRTFVALYRPTYFERKWCGREWAAFEHRQNLAREAGSVAYNAIIPVLWVGEHRLPRRLPRVAQRLQYEDISQHELYRTQGIWGLRFGQYDVAYARTTLAIAQAIVGIADSTQIPLCDLSAFPEDANAFTADSE
jgi:hypothetical protein